MLKSVILLLLVSSIGLAVAQDLQGAGARKLKTNIAYGPGCTGSFFKSAPGYTGPSNTGCCDKSQGFICATYKGDNQWSTYASCMTPDACTANNGGAPYKSPGWNCNPINNNPFPECQTYYAGDTTWP